MSKVLILQENEYNVQKPETCREIRKKKRGLSSIGIGSYVTTTDV